MQRARETPRYNNAQNNAVVTTLSLQRCRYNAVVTTLSLQRCHSRRPLPPTVGVYALACVRDENTLKRTFQRRLASRRDEVFQRFDPPVVFAALDHRLMAFILPGYKIKDARPFGLIPHLKNTE